MDTRIHMQTASASPSIRLLRTPGRLAGATAAFCGSGSFFAPPQTYSQQLVALARRAWRLTPA